MLFRSREHINSGSWSQTFIDASNYSDNFFVEFEHKGCVNFYKNEEEEMKYRTVFKIFYKSSGYFQNSYLFFIHLNNNNEKTFRGYLNEDSIAFETDFGNLPLQKKFDDNYSYSYNNYYVKVN